MQLVGQPGTSLTTVWSTKGGVGVSSIAALLAITQVELGYDTVLVDLCGDQPALLGLDESDTGNTPGAGDTRGFEATPAPGLGEWCATEARSADTLVRVERQVRSRLWLIAQGALETRADAVADLTRALRASAKRVVIDCGRIDQPGAAQDIAAVGDRRFQVVRPCYLTLRRARSTTVEPTGVIMVAEPGRALRLADVEAAVAAPVVVQVAVDRAIARSIDVGLVSSRPPRALVRALAKVVADDA